MTSPDRPSRRILIIGGVAGGASCAARARRLDEHAEITIFERGPHVSFANCGLPYHVGGVIPEASSLLLASPDTFRDKFGIDVQIRTEVTAIDREAQTLTTRHTESGETRTWPYDALVIATGAKPLMPPLPGLDLPGVFTVRTVPDTARIRAWIDERGAKRAVVVGGGFIGLEIAENLHHRALEVTVLERADQVMPPLDPEMAGRIEDHLAGNGIEVRTGAALKGIEATGGGLRVQTEGGDIDADLVILGMGVRPESTLAREAGLALGPHGGIHVNGRMQTSDAHIYAVGDVVEDTCAVTGQPMYLPLAGPANRQGRLAADAILGRPGRFRGVQGTSVCGLMGLTAASTGLAEKALRPQYGERLGVVWLHPGQHVGYYPGAKTIHLKLVYDQADGRVLGAQAVGADGVEKRIDVIAMAMQMGATVFDLEEAELCYAPQFGAAKDPVNVAGMIAANRLRGDLPMASWAAWQRAGTGVLVDVREPDEYAAGHVEGAINVPLSQIRGRLDELPQGETLWLYCKSGKRSYDAARMLTQRGFDVHTLSGGIMSYPR